MRDSRCKSIRSAWEFFCWMIVPVENILFTKSKISTGIFHLAWLSPNLNFLLRRLKQNLSRCIPGRFSHYPSLSEGRKWIDKSLLCRLPEAECPNLLSPRFSISLSPAKPAAREPDCQRGKEPGHSVSDRPPGRLLSISLPLAERQWKWQ